MKRRVGAAIGALFVVWMDGAAPAAQWEPYPWKNVPRKADGSIDMQAPPRRTADGKVDMSGFWMPVEA